MSTRAYVTIVDKDGTVLDSAFYPSSAYPSYLGTQVLDAIDKGELPNLLAEIRDDFPHEKDMLDGIQRSWYVKDKENRDDYFYDYGYEFDASKSRLNLYHFGDKVLTITPDTLSLFHFLFEQDDALYYPLCLDQKTMTLRKDYYNEVRAMLKNGAGQTDFQALLDQSGSILYLDSCRMMDVGGRDPSTNFIKPVYDTGSSNRLKFIVNKFYSDGDFSISVQTPFYRMPIHTSSKLRSAAAAEKELANIVRERPDDIRGTAALFQQLEAYSKEVHTLYHQDELTINDRADRARDLKLEIMVKLRDTAAKIKLIGPSEHALISEVNDVIYREHRAALSREEKKRQAHSLADMLDSASGRSGNCAVGEKPGRQEEVIR